MVCFYPAEVEQKWLGMYVHYFTRLFDYFLAFYVAEYEHILEILACCLCWCELVHRTHIHTRTVTSNYHMHGRIGGIHTVCMYFNHICFLLTRLWRICCSWTLLSRTTLTDYSTCRVPGMKLSVLATMWLESLCPRRVRGGGNKSANVSARNRNQQNVLGGKSGL
jgi:hypothetical protein